MNEISGDIPPMAFESDWFLGRNIHWTLVCVAEYNVGCGSGTKDLSHGNESRSRPKWLSFIDRQPHTLGNNSEKLFRSLSSRSEISAHKSPSFLDPTWYIGVCKCSLRGIRIVYSPSIDTEWLFRSRSPPMTIHPSHSLIFTVHPTIRFNVLHLNRVSSLFSPRLISLFSFFFFFSKLGIFKLDRCPWSRQSFIKARGPHLIMFPSINPVAPSKRVSPREESSLKFLKNSH